MKEEFEDEMEMGVREIEKGRFAPKPFTSDDNLILDDEFADLGAIIEEEKARMNEARVPDPPENSTRAFGLLGVYVANPNLRNLIEVLREYEYRLRALEK